MWNRVRKGDVGGSRIEVHWARRSLGTLLLGALVAVASPLLWASLSGRAASWQFFSQQDRLWADDHLGTSDRTIGQDGCAMTCVAMILAHYGVTITPKSLNQYLSDHRGYTYHDEKGITYANIDWAVSDDASNGTVQYEPLARRDWEGVAADLQVVNGYLDAGQPVIAATRWSNVERLSHFVVIYRRAGSTYYMYDPMDPSATTVSFNDRYGDPARWVYGIRVFSTSGGQPGTPSLTVDGGTRSSKKQLEVFTFVGTGLTPGASVTQHIQKPDKIVQDFSAVVSPTGTMTWSYTPPCTAAVGTYTVWVEDPYRGASNQVYEVVAGNASCSTAPPEQPSTATILVMDVSGSMGYAWKGGVKIDSAKEAALQFIEQVTNESRTRGGQHMIGVVAFSGQAQLLLPLTSDYQRARQVIISLSATNSTNVGAGLTAALTEFDETKGETQRLIILLSDGNSNTGLSKDQVLSVPVVEALRKHVCVHTVAFGDPGDVDDAFLRRIASGSGCGSYSLAQTGFELFSTFLKLRDASLGQIAGEYSSAGRQVTFVAGSPVVLGTIIVGSGKDELHLTLAWSAEGTLQARLKDPSGRLVTSAYAGAEVYSSRRFAHITVYTPSGGAWTIEAAPTTQMPSGTEYYAVLSTRPGGIALPLPLPVFTIGGQTFGLPAGLPTWLLVAAGVALLALAVYAKLSDLW